LIAGSYFYIFCSPVARELIEIVVESDEDSDSDSSSVVISPIPIPSNFSVQYLLESGLFTPGPLRPKVQKSDRKKGYQYHKLKQLDTLLNNSMAEDIRNGRVSTMMVQHQCYTYGVVVEVVEDVSQLQVPL